MRSILLIAALFFVAKGMLSQDGFNNVQPTIMVVPWKKQADAFISKIEEQREYRVAIAKVDELFLSRGFRTVDFTANFEIAMQDNMLAMDSDVSIEQQIAMNTNADIIVYFDLEYRKEGGSRAADIYLKAIDVQTAQVFASQSGRSNEGSFDDVNLYIDNALDKIGDNFLNTLQEQFEDVKENGRPLRVSFELDLRADFDFEEEIGDDYLYDIITDQLYEIAYKGYANCPVLLADRIACDDVRIPLSKGGRAYTPNNFFRELRRSLRLVGYNSKSVTIGNNLRIKISRKKL